MNSTRRRSQWFYSAMTSALLLTGLAIPASAWSAEAGSWSFAGGDLRNSRYQDAEHTLSVDNVGALVVRWVFTTAGDVSATPAVDASTVYVPDWAGYLYAVDKYSGALKWAAHIPSATGVLSDKARTTPAVTKDKVIVGTTGAILVGGGAGGKLLAFDKLSGALVWSTQLDTHPAAVVTQSPTVFAGRVYVGVSSVEEILAAIVPEYPCCSFAASMFALAEDTGARLWKTSMVPTGFSGGAIWGSSPSVDAKRGQIYIATGNNYSVPPSVLACVAEAGSDPIATTACLPSDDHFDSVLALDLRTGAVKWATRAIPYDAYTVDCLPVFGDGGNCPSPAGPDFDFGQAPALFMVKGVNGNKRPIELVGAGQKSGQYWTLNPDTGAVQWVAHAGPGGYSGGLQWGSAVDGARVYTANANSNRIPWPGAADPTSGVWTGLDAASGTLLWQARPPDGGSTSGPVTTANGVVFGCSLDPLGHMYALNGATGAVLWSFVSGGSCLSGAAISDGMLFWGSGYGNLNGFYGTPNNKLYSFGLPN
ncbi:PQQ-binding-like beta-propeller repeat protein [uncultured Piscinibacter sp.]|uniref:outer membrane protein assembly factor BamB family protein n=1 Tax=uncultured Piscinibacter sp. TaxID=1131835 RepID=UPI002639CB4C|nr:PQQ-binding-like beta-propeller repeat protein [uncultured Piscinibacter sp.]